ncbi:hypothetical protein C1889_09255 [Pseudomonas sp. FW507-12TSA]|nr:hypothetical protein C1889_09255 [Pseudomonas sp. FW507-12TSA]
MLFIENRHLLIMIIGDPIKNEVLAFLLLGFGSSLISLPVASAWCLSARLPSGSSMVKLSPGVSMAI